MDDVVCEGCNCPKDWCMCELLKDYVEGEWSENGQ